MKIAIDIREAGGEKAGKGWYTFLLTQNILKLDTKNEYILYTKLGVPGFEQYKNATQKLISGRGPLWHRNVIKDLQKEEIDLYFAPSSYIIPSLIPPKIKTIFTVHDLIAILYPKKHNRKAVLIEKLTLKKALKKADHIITVSNHTKNDLTEKFLTPANKISVTHLAANPTYREATQETLTKFKKETNLPSKFFLAVGTIIPRKNYENLLKAFALIKKENLPHHLIIVGSKGWNFKEVEKLIIELNLEKYVHILGYLSDQALNNLYNLAESLVFPSIYEGFGLPPLEAMQASCPVIVSSTSSLPEVTDHAALQIEPSDPKQIANAMITVATKPDLRQDLINKGQTQAQKFSWQMTAQKTLDIFNRLLA